MKKFYLLAMLLIATAATQALTSCGKSEYNTKKDTDSETASGIKYDGQDVTVNYDYVRTQCGTTDRNIVKEVSGLACSRVTLGYLWANIDEGNQYIYALNPNGSLMATLSITGMVDRDDWEDICTGTYNGVKYIFVGAFGDNNQGYADQYYIACIPEPALTSTKLTAEATVIRFGFPNHAAFNVETLMYDTKTQTFYIVNKVKNEAPTIYKLPMSLTYGTALQTLTPGPALGVKADSWFQVTGGDISPDGSLVAIKNESQIFLWKRQGSEDIFTTVARTPQAIGTYSVEEQGESLAWLDNNTFYTTSDSKNDTPIYKYTKAGQ